MNLQLNIDLRSKMNDPKVAVSEHDFKSRRSQPKYLEALRLEHLYIMLQPQVGTLEHFSKQENEEKNRYFDVACWDTSRVKITPKGGNNDYIHANYVDTCGRPKKFVATQGPLKETVNQFWQMVWEQNSRIIVMLTELQVDGNEKCAQYWYAFGDKQDIFQANELSIKTIVENKTNSGYIMSLFDVYNSITKENRLILHFRYVDWPEYGAPPNSKTFLDLILDINNQYRSILNNAVDGQPPGPIIVHCSAGVGRTGTFCAADSCIYQLAKTREVSVPKIVMQMRQQRYSSVLSLEQYIFIHSVLYELLQLLDTSPDMRQFFSQP